MKVKFEMEEQRFKKLINTKPIKIKIPDSKSKFYMISVCVLVISLLISCYMCFKIGSNYGYSDGYNRAYDNGYQNCIGEKIHDLTVSQAIAYDIKFNFHSYLKTLGLIVGLGWVIHGVGFYIIR